MTLLNLDKAPFPWFGGKSKAAPLIWQLLGDVPHYVEPFAGSCAVLLNRPHPCNRPYVSETVNDRDGFVVNFWRSIAFSPVETAHAASWPVSEADKQARQIALLRWMDEHVARLAGDAAWHCPIMAGWWAWAICCQIGAFNGRQGWTADQETGRIYLQPRGVTREPGVARNFPHLNNEGKGVNRPSTREPGVAGDRPHLGNDGMGVNHAGTREPGVLDPITDRHGRSQLDAIDWGATFHDQTMPELIRWFRYLAARLRHVRVVNGEWSRVCTDGAAKTLPVRQGKGPAGVFLDPPYADTAKRSSDLYVAESYTVAHDVREWALARTDDPDLRIVVAGFNGEHGSAFEDAGWSVHEWFTAGHLTGGYGNIAKGKGTGDNQQKLERLWASPSCLPIAAPAEPEAMLWGAE